MLFVRRGRRVFLDSGITETSREHSIFKDVDKPGKRRWKEVGEGQGKKQ